MPGSRALVPARNRTVVFCHGTPWSAGLWEPIADALSSQFTVHLWDMPGYGSSEMTEGQDVSPAAQGELLAALLEHWQPPASRFRR